MFHVLYGSGSRGKFGRHDVSGCFGSFGEAVDAAEAIAAKNSFYWGKATDYRIILDSGAVVFDAALTEHCPGSARLHLVYKAADAG